MAEPAGPQDELVVEEEAAAGRGRPAEGRPRGRGRPPGAGELDGRIPVENPATGETIATVPALGAEEVRAIVGRAREAQPGWEAAGFTQRAEVLMAALSWLVANAERVVTTIVAETGRPA